MQIMFQVHLGPCHVPLPLPRWCMTCCTVIDNQPESDWLHLWRYGVDWRACVASSTTQRRKGRPSRRDSPAPTHVVATISAPLNTSTTAYSSRLWACALAKRTSVHIGVNKLEQEVQYNQGVPALMGIDRHFPRGNIGSSWGASMHCYMCTIPLHQSIKVTWGVHTCLFVCLA